MCDYVSAAAALMSMVGGAASASAQTNARATSDRATADAMNAETARQTGYQESAMAGWQKQLGQMDINAQNRGAAEKTADRQAGYDSIAPASRDYNSQAADVGSPSSSPRIIKDANASSLADALAQTRGQLAAKAKLGGFADQTFANGEMLTKGAAETGMWGNFSKGSAGLSPLELQVASRAGGSGASTLGTLLSTAGVGLGMANAAGAFKPAAAAATTGPVAGAVRGDGGYMWMPGTQPVGQRIAASGAAPSLGDLY